MRGKAESHSVCGIVWAVVELAVGPARRPGEPQLIAGRSAAGPDRLPSDSAFSALDWLLSASTPAKSVGKW